MAKPKLGLLDANKKIDLKPSKRFEIDVYDKLLSELTLNASQMYFADGNQHPWELCCRACLNDHELPVTIRKWLFFDLLTEGLEKFDEKS